MGVKFWVNFFLVLSIAACLCLYIYARRGAASFSFTSYSPTVANYPSPPPPLPMAAQTANPLEPESNRSPTTPPPEAGFGPELGRSRFRTIAVYCGSSPGRKASYQEAAVELGRELVERRIDLVYGGGSVGLMGLVAQAVHDGGRHVLGVIPKSLMPREICGETVGELKAVSDMHERKAEMARLADAFIALPGGYGTLEELLEVITWAQLGIHKKPVGLLNVDGFYNSLLSFVDMAVDEGFISKTARRIIVSAPSAKELVRMLEEYVPQFDDFVSKLSWEVERPIAGPEMENGIA